MDMWLLIRAGIFLMLLPTLLQFVFCCGLASTYFTICVSAIHWNIRDSEATLNNTDEKVTAILYELIV